MKLSRSIVILIVLSLMLSFVACSQTENQPDVTTSAQVTTTKAVTTTQKQAETTAAVTTTEKVEENPMAEFYEISWLHGMCANYDEGAWDVCQL